MERDPLLPQALCPADYLGREAYALHVEFHRTAAKLL